MAGFNCGAVAGFKYATRVGVSVRVIAVPVFCRHFVLVCSHHLRAQLRAFRHALPLARWHAGAHGVQLPWQSERVMKQSDTRETLGKAWASKPESRRLFTSFFPRLRRRSEAASAASVSRHPPYTTRTAPMSANTQQIRACSKARQRPGTSQNAGLSGKRSDGGTCCVARRILPVASLDGL